MSDAAVKETRRVLRQVQSHLTQSRLNLGATCEMVGFVEVMHHAQNPLPQLNYVTPRKNTAWVSVKDVEQGLAALHQYNRQQRVEYIDALFPEAFATNLLQIGLEIERETPVLVYQPENPAKFPAMAMPDGVSMETVNSHEGSAMWWYVWRNAYYDVITQTAEPIFIGTSQMQIAMGQQIDLVMRRYGFPVGVARVSLFPENATGHLTALALMREVRTPELLKLLQRYAVKSALNRGCSMVFTTGVTDDERQLSRENGFVDYGQVVCYAEKNDEHSDLNEFMAQPVLALN
ncbi:MAG: hypothetical protein H7X77_03510 [Anaerolineae bacterium]|nr:hypothetical protein [Anaerolineae bacterium]